MYEFVIFLLIAVFLSFFTLPFMARKGGIKSDNMNGLWNKIEDKFRLKNGRETPYLQEKMPVLEVENASELAELSALTFLDWVIKNPKGVIALPVGKRAGPFVESLKYLKAHWKSDDVQNDLQACGFHQEHFPDTSQLHIVQLYEFFPIDPKKKSSFTAIMKDLYAEVLMIPDENFLTLTPEVSKKLESDPQKALLSTEDFREVQSYCSEFDKKLISLGGIGFFMDFIGPKGEVGINNGEVSTGKRTGLTKLGYTQAAYVAADVGGIDESRDKTVLTIGLDMITTHSNAIIIFCAVGEAYASIVGDIVQKSPQSNCVASTFQGINGARLYVTKGAAAKLQGRIVEDIEKCDWEQFTSEQIDDNVIELALKVRKEIIELEMSDFYSFPKSAAFIKKYRGKLDPLLEEVHARLVQKIRNSDEVLTNEVILHTAPHHDDLMLSYHPLFQRALQENKNHFVYFTSGFKSVTDMTILSYLHAIHDDQIEIVVEECIGIKRSTLLKAAAEASDDQRLFAEGKVLIKNIEKGLNFTSTHDIVEKFRWLRDKYFPHQSRVENEASEIQLLKGMMRESESERMLLKAGVSLSDISHLRTKFYSKDCSSQKLDQERDLRSFLELSTSVSPTLVTVALDAEGSGPDTHYKVLKLVVEGFKSGIPSVKKVWGYRNVWNQFSLSEANLIFPVTAEEQQNMHQTFMTCFTTQKNAAFPSVEHDGPFSEIASAKQKSSFQALQILLGKKFFSKEVEGVILIKELTPETLVKKIT